MRKFVFLILLGLSSTSFAQNYEIVTLVGFVPNGSDRNFGDVFQFKFERKLSKSLSLQTGLRYNSDIQYRSGYSSENSMIITNTYKCYKFDVSILAIPINKNHFKLKTGLGFDVGSSLYTQAWKGVTQTVLTPQGDMEYEYWQYKIQTVVDYGMHFIIMPNYYFDNNLFLSSQILYNPLFDELKYSPDFLRQSTLSFNVGVGFRF